MDTLPPLNATPRPLGLSLLRRFTLLSFITTILVSAIFGLFTARLVEDFAMRRQARATAEQIWALIDGSHLVLDDLLLPASPKKTRIEAALRSLVGTAGILHVTVWNRQGTALFRDDVPQQGDSAVVRSTPFRTAFQGQLQWERRDANPRPARLEILVPVSVAGTEKPSVVFQVLFDMSTLAPAVARLKWSVELRIVLGVLSLYAVLFTIVRKASHDLDHHQAMLRRSLVGMIRSLINALDVRDMATASHSSQVAETAVSIARELGLGETIVREVEIAGFLHDVGKIGIPDDILAKRGPLTYAERTIMEAHAVLGAEILDPVPITNGVKLAVRHSHESWDGSGYPDGLIGSQIPIAARIVAVADAYEALTSNRPYRIARSPEQAIEELRRNAGSQFDPQVIEAFLRIWQRARVAGAVNGDGASQTRAQANVPTGIPSKTVRDVRAT